MNCSNPHSTFLVLGLVLAAAPACQREAAQPAATETTAQARQPAAALKLSGLYPLDVVSGSTPLRVEAPPEAEQLELWVNGQAAVQLPATGQHSWDSHGTPDGLTELQLRGKVKGRPLAGEPLQLVVLNKGGEVFFKNGSNGTVEIPPSVGSDGHLRFHWDQPTASRKILALLSWPDPDFELELAIGTGSCPHHGIEKAKAQGRRSPLAVVYEPAPGEAFATGQWFAHVRAKNPQDLTGRQTPFEVRAFKLD